MARENRSRLAFDPGRFFTGRRAGQSHVQRAAEQIIYAQDAADDAIFYIEKGWVKISVVSPGGKEAVLAIRGAGTFFGTRSLIERHRRGTAATALSDCSLLRIGRTAAIQLLRTEPDFAEMFTTYLVRQALRDQASLTDQLTDTSERRLARALLRLAGDSGSQQSQFISTPIKQADLASMIGTTRSRVSHFMNKFRRQGLIGYNRQGYVTIHKALARSLRDR